MALTTKTKARIKLGQHFMGEKTSTTAEGVALYGEWDASDKRSYYWEEWELRGFNDIDSWIEYDHYTNKISLYEPIRHTEKIDPRGLSKGQVVQFKDGNTVQNLTVTEAGTGKLVKLRGTVSYHIFEGDTLEYAELAGNNTRYTAERYNDNEFDMYRARVLDKKEQKRILGRVVEPFAWKKILNIIFWIIICGFYGASAWPRQETTCTPRTVSSAPAMTATQSASDTTTGNQVCSTRTVYGFGGSGGGIGK